MAHATTSQRCACPGGHCEHHAASEPCPNKVVVSFPFAISPDTGAPVSNSASELCQKCFSKKIAAGSEKK